MKKSTLKQKLTLSLMKQGVLIDMLKASVNERDEMSEALDRRRVLYERVVNHSTEEKPKSMKEMAEALYNMFGVVGIGMPTFQELSDAEQDLWMDRLLIILN